MPKMSISNKTVLYSVLLLLNLFYATIIIATKWTSNFAYNSWSLIFAISLVFLLFFAYAVVWQQLLKKVSLSVAYMFKGSSIIFIMLASWLLFNESISLNNLLGCCLIIIGILIMFFKK